MKGFVFHAKELRLNLRAVRKNYADQLPAANLKLLKVEKVHFY